MTPTPLILYATMTGNALDAARLLAERLEADGSPPPRIEQMSTFHPVRLVDERLVLFITSTFGNGDPPDSAFAFWDILRKADELDLKQLRYSVCAFGDSSYPRFCQYGRDLDRRLEVLGAQRIAPAAFCDVDWEEPFAKWVDGVAGEVQRV